jgi:hypothetical protein
MLASRLALASFALVLLVPSSAVANDDAPEKRWGVTIWGLSYHVNKSIDYAAGNWGVGARYYIKPRRLFLEADALRNSNRGLVLPVSAGAEFGIGTAGCQFSLLAALTAAYYRNPRRDTTEIKWGPVPGVTIGCGRIKTNVVAVLSKSSEPLAAIAASLTILF